MFTLKDIGWLDGYFKGLLEPPNLIKSKGRRFSSKPSLRQTESASVAQNYGGEIFFLTKYFFPPSTPMEYVLASTSRTAGNVYPMEQINTHQSQKSCGIYHT
jgi:hypothetical protein